MKKITITLLLLIFVLNAMGQTNQTIQIKNHYAPLNLPINKSLNLNLKSNSRANVGGDSVEWISYALAMANAVSAASNQIGGNFLFPDTIPLVDFSNGNGGEVLSNPWVHELGNVFDLYSPNLATQYGFPTVPTTTPYSLDSMGFEYAYKRNDNSVTDTLVLYIFNAAFNSKDIPDEAIFGANGSNFFLSRYGYDTLYWSSIMYNYLTNSPADVSAPITEVRIPLTEADTSVTYFNIKYFALPSTINVPAGNLVATAFTFHPGYRYTAGENIDSLENTLTFTSLDEVPGGWPVYLYGDDNNPSSIITNPQVIDSLGNGWQPIFLPEYYFDSTYTFDDHFIYYHVKFLDTPASIRNVANLVLNQNIYPNPSSDYAMLTYTLNTGASVIININDITGRVITTMNEGNVIAGKNEQIIDTRDLPDGVYLVSIIANGNTSVSKLVVAR